MEGDNFEDKNIQSDRQPLTDDRSTDTNIEDASDNEFTIVPAQCTSTWIYKNLAVITTAFLFHFTAYNGLGNLQSSLHREEGLGTVTQSVVYSCLIFSSLFLPRPFIAKLGQKWTIVLGILGYMTWMGANGFAVWWTMVPTSAVVGLCASPLWVSCNSYITKIATVHAQLKHGQKDVAVTKFFGIFGAIFSISNVISSVTSSLILESTLKNESQIPVSDLQFCGANDCPWKNASNGTNGNLQPVSQVIIWTLVGTYLVMAIIGLCLVVFFLDKLPAELQDKTHATSVWKETIELVLATLKMNNHKIMLLLIPWQLWNGLYFGLSSAEWPASYIMCTVGVAWVGYITIPAGVLQSIFSHAGGVLNKHTGRIPLITISKLMQLGILFALLLWKPSPHQLYIFFIISCFMGLSLGFQGPQLNGLISVAFKGKIVAAFSNLQFWSSIGAATSYAYSNEVCNYIKLYLLIGLFFLSMIGYYISEWLNKQTVIVTLEKVNDLNCQDEDDNDVRN